MVALCLNNGAVRCARLMQRVGIREKKPLCGARNWLIDTEPKRGIFAGKAVAACLQFRRTQHMQAGVAAGQPLGKRECVVGRAVVDHKNVPLLPELEARFRLPQQRFKTALQVMLFIAGGNEHGELVRGGLIVFQLHMRSDAGTVVRKPRRRGTAIQPQRELFLLHGAFAASLLLIRHCSVL